MQFLSKLNLKTLSTLLACVSLTQAAGSEQDAIASPDSAVVKLTSKTFSKFLSENPLVLAEFFAPWCGHCKALGPQYSEAADALVDRNIKLAQIDCTEESELCQEHGIRGYPTLKVFRGEENQSDYEGPRQAEGIVQYMVKQSLPAVSLIDDSAELAGFIDSSLTPVVVETGSNLNTTFYQLSESNREEYSFVQTKASEFASKYGDEKILLFTKEFPEPIVYSGEDESADAIAEWLKVESLPYFGELDGSTYQKYTSANVPLAYLFYNTPEEKEAWRESITKLAQEHRGKINFVGLDASKFGRHAENLNMDQEFPLFVIHDGVSNKKYGYPQDTELTTEAVEEFVKRYDAGEIEPIVKTEEIPEVQENAVYKIVGKTHDAIINDDTRDVLVKYYAPWCGHCKRLAPVYEELAEVYQSNSKASKKVRVANVDATLNDVDVEIQGYPTLILYPAGDKSNPIVHQGGRDLQALADFIKEKGTHGVDIDALEEDDEVEAEAEEPVTEDEQVDAEEEAKIQIEQEDEAAGHDEL